MFFFILADESAAMTEKTSFARSFKIEKITLGSLPMWLRITLTKNT